MSFGSTDGDWKATGPPMPGLAWVQPVGRWWRCDFRMERNRSPDAQIRVFGLGVGDGGSPMYQHCIHPFQVCKF